jgi:SAM-dependent methyltransferase
MKPSNRPYFEIANPEIPNILAALPRELDVLDVGCGSGVHGAELDRIHGHRVVGVDLSETSIQKAKIRLVEAYVADVTKPENYEFFGRRKFDVIVFSDILEHLYDPFDVLTRHYQLLAPGGHVLISLPNVAIWNVRLELLAGRFEYQDTGTLDRTHIRFFTRRTFHQFARKAGLDIHRSRISPGILRPFVPLIKKLYGNNSQPDSSSIMDSGPYRFYMKWFYPIERAICGTWPSLLAFQFVILAEPISGWDVAKVRSSNEELAEPARTLVHP